MTISEALRRGIEALNRRKRMWLVFYAVTTLWALIVVAPVIMLLYASLGHSAWAEQMAQNFDAQWVAELLLGGGNPAPLGPIVVAVAAVFAVAAVAHLFLLGGAIEIFCARESFSAAAFFQGCGRNFWRFVRLALVSILFYIVVGIINRLLNLIGDKVWGEGSRQTPLIYWAWFRTVVVLALAGIVNLIFDYGRIRLVAADTRKAFKCALESARFVFANFRATAGLYAALWAVFAVIVGVYRGISAVLVQRSVGLVLLLFVVRQATVLARVWVQLLFYASQTEMYLALAPVIAEEADNQTPVLEETVLQPDTGASIPPEVVTEPGISSPDKG